MLLLLADDHVLVREGLKHTLSELAPSVAFIEAATASDVMDCLTKTDAIQLALLDLVMPGSNGFELLTRVCKSYPDLPVVILSAEIDPAQMRKALDIGAAGFIPKSATSDVMLSALRLVMAGGTYVPPDMLRPETVDVTKSIDAEAPGLGKANGHKSVLTARQREVLACLGQGKSNKLIARELGLSENTVKIHVAAILRTLGVDNRTQAAVLVREQGLDTL